MPPHLEILVHASGPSRGRDDTRYRKEAQGLLEFLSRRNDDNVEKAVEVGNEEQESLFSLTSSTSHESVTTSNESSIGPTQRIKAIQELFHKNVPSTTPKGTPIGSRNTHTPAAAGAARRVSPIVPYTSIKETPRLLIERTPALIHSHTAPSTPSRARKSTLRRSQSESWHSPPSIVPDSQPPASSPGPEISSSPTMKRPLGSSFTSEGEEPTSSPTAKRPRLASPSLPLNESFPSNLSSDILLSPDRRAPLMPTSSQPTSSVSSTKSSAEVKLPLEINSKLKPAVGNHKFTTHLTQPLIQLANTPDMIKLGIECHLTRPLGLIERGYWRVSLSTWSRDAKNELWRILQDFIGRGKAGWGVWCRREMQERWRRRGDGDRGNGDGTGYASDKENETPEMEEILRVWCFGEVVREVFLVLFVAGVNRKKNPGARAEWVDARGAVVGTVTGKSV